MKKLFTLLTLAVFSFGLVAFDAEAKRFGGGKSVGKQREAISPQAAPKSGQAPAAARTGSRWWKQMDGTTGWSGRWRITGGAIHGRRIRGH